jgi:outer membrane lipoprotein SlyB
MTLSLGRNMEAAGQYFEPMRLKREARILRRGCATEQRVRINHHFRDKTMTTSAMKTASPLKLAAVAMACGLSVAACTDSQQRVAAGGAVGAVAGGLIGYAVGGPRGALVGAAIGGVSGLVIADAIEQQRMRDATLAAARSGGASSQSFRNSKGEAVVIRTRTVRTYQTPERQRVRVIERSVTRNGQAAGSQTVEARETKLASGGTEWVAPE